MPNKCIRFKIMIMIVLFLWFYYAFRRTMYTKEKNLFLLGLMDRRVVFHVLTNILTTLVS